MINVDVDPYVCRLEDLRLFPWTLEALRLLDSAGFDLYVVSNQQGVALGLIDPFELDRITEAIQATLREHHLRIRRFYYSVGRSDDPWRKPRPDMVHQAGRDFGFDPWGSFLIGDKDTDIECADAAGCRPILVLSGVTAEREWESWSVQPERVFENVLEAARWIVANHDDGREASSALPPA